MKTQDFEKIMYDKKLAYRAWINHADVGEIAPSEECTKLVWELLVDFGYSKNYNDVKDDLYKTAYELASIVLISHPLKRILRVFRDYLIDALLEFTDYNKDENRMIIYFSNTLSSAFCEARIDQLKKSMRKARTEHLSNELRLAKNIQHHLLPKTLPSIEGFEFAGRLEPAAEIGGDYWSIKHQKDDGIVTMKLADITGHGVAAATLVAAVKFISGGYYPASKSAREVMNKTNTVLTKETPHDILISMVYGWLRPGTFDLTLVNAGLEPVFVCSENTCTDIKPTGPVMGLYETTDYQEEHIHLKKNDLVFFGSDGIVEAGIGEKFGMERLKKLVFDLRDLSADDIADKVVEAVAAFAKIPNDDISLVVLKVTGEQN